MTKIWALLILIVTSSSASIKRAKQPELRFNNEKTYKYTYTMEVLLDRGGRIVEESTGYRIISNVNLDILWTNPSNDKDHLIRVAISDVKFETVANRSDDENIFKDTSGEGILGKNYLSTLQSPVLIHWINGKVESFYTHSNEPLVIQNIKRGLASLFQLQVKSGSVREVDVSGECKVNYKAQENHVTKEKLLNSCKVAKKGFVNHNKVLGVSINATSGGIFVLKGNFIHTILYEEHRLISLNLQQELAVKIISNQKLVFQATKAGPKQITGKEVSDIVKSVNPKFVAVSLVSENVKADCQSCPSLKEHWQSVQKELEPEKLVRASATRSFLSLIQTLRKAKKQEILQVLRSAKSSLLPQLVDAVTSAQTSASLKAMLEFLDFGNASTVILQERFLYACGFASHPNEEMLKALMGKLNGKIESNDIQETVVIIMGALIRKLCQKKLCELPTVIEAKKLILEGLENTEKESEIMMYILSLKNALLPEAIPLLLKQAESGSGPISNIAVNTIQKYDSQHITEKVKKVMNRIYHQNLRVYEKTVRTSAANVIFNNKPSYMEVKNILLSLGELPPEMNKYLLSKVQDILRFELPASEIMRQVLKESVTHNYDRFAKIGSSSAYSGHMKRGIDSASTYSLDILYSGSGILRKSNMDIFILSQEKQMHATQVVIEAQGLESLIAATPDEGEEELESLARMSAVLFDVQLRPVTFFHGYSDLMAKMFTATGEPINVVKGLILLVDHSQVLRLASGLLADVEFQGGLAIDISGGMDFSLWYRESKTTVANRGAMVVVGNVMVDSLSVKTGIETSVETEAQLDFVSTVKFSEYPFLVCMQMTKDQFPYRQFVTKYERLSSGKAYVSRKGKKILIPGSEFPLHQENSNMCKRVFAGQSETETYDWF
uniref:Microsomal triglyceride transfer protein large subunit-like protein n=1 Tax=Callorhinchus milii TaxID=7868 RepID=V9KD53_CALMI